MSATFKTVVKAEEGLRLGTSSTPGNILVASDENGNVDYAEPTRVVEAGSLGSTETLDVDGDPVVWLTGVLDDDCVLTISNLPAGPAQIKLFLEQDETGGFGLSLTDGVDTTSLNVPQDPEASVIVDIFSPDGETIYVDIAGGETPTVPGQEIAFVERTGAGSDFSTASTTPVPVPDLSIWVPPTSKPYMLRAFTPGVASSLDRGVAIFEIRDVLNTATVVASRVNIPAPSHGGSNGTYGSMVIERRMDPHVDARLYQVYVTAGASTTVTLFTFFGTQGPIFLQAQYV